jgi:hypothetical protein
VVANTQTSFVHFSKPTATAFEIGIEAYNRGMPYA